MIERSGDVVCGLHLAQGDKEHKFLGSASKPRLTVSPGLTSKPEAMVSPSFASKPVATIPVVWPQNHSLEFLSFGPQNWQLWFGDLAHKITVIVSWFESQNQEGGGLSVCTSKPMSG
jgi:hypothetical protein